MAPSRTHLRIARRHQQEVTSAIRRAGFHATHGVDDQVHTTVSYTTGFLLAGHAELVTLGLHASDSLVVFERIMAEVREGGTRTVGRHMPDQIDGEPVCLLPVPAEHWTGTDCLLPGIASFYRRRRLPVADDRVLQVVWADADGRFPWDDDVDVTAFRDQPVLADGDAPRRRWPLDEPIDNRSRWTLCGSDPPDRAERRHPSRRKA